MNLWWKPHFYILNLSPPEMKVTLHLSWWIDWGPWAPRNFWNIGFHSFVIMIHFSSRFDQFAIFKCYILQNMHLDKNNCFEAKCGESNLWRGKLVFNKILSLELLSQFFTSIEFSYVNSTDKNFILELFQSTRGEHGPHPETIWS